MLIPDPTCLYINANRPIHNSCLICYLFDYVSVAIIAIDWL